MQTSRVIAPRRSETVELPDPVPGDGEVLVDVIACGVCTSDRTPWREEGTEANPIRLGHEMVARVADPNGSTWEAGDVVTGLGGLGFSTRAVMKAHELVRVPVGVAPELALGEPLADLIEALDRCALRPGARVAIVGLGFMGLGLVQLVRARHPGVLVGVDVQEGARLHGLQNGAHEVYHPSELPPEYTTASDPERRFDLVLEVTGVTPGLTLAGTLVRPYGTLCVVGYHHSGTAMRDMELWYKGATIVNGFGPDRARKVAAMQKGMDLIAGGGFDYRPLITHRFHGLDQLDAAYGLMERSPGDFVKSVIFP